MDARERCEWRKKANRLLTKQYGIELHDCTDDGRPTDDWYEEDPQNFVNWVADKYDLDVLTRAPW
jgi:hypothetical protein